MKDKKTTTATTPEGKALTYSEAVTELGRVIDSMETGDLNIDELSGKIAAATELLDYCEKALHVIEQNATELMKAASRQAAGGNPSK